MAYNAAQQERDYGSKRASEPEVRSISKSRPFEGALGDLSSAVTETADRLDLIENTLGSAGLLAPANETADEVPAEASEFPIIAAIHGMACRVRNIERRLASLQSRLPV